MEKWTREGTVRLDQSICNGPISDLVASFSTDAAVGETHEGDPPSQGHDFSLSSVQLAGPSMANSLLPHKILSLVLFSATKSNTGDFSVKVIRKLMAPH